MIYPVAYVVIGVLFAHSMAISFDVRICLSRPLVLYPLGIYGRVTIWVLNSDAFVNSHMARIMIGYGEGIVEKR